ncbi:hypothetical protein Pelo_7377C [Pelomyxa schiedti]|nr:hypothetical protein Pelo_7377C [Pelomyxa schiedti]
MDLEYTTWIMFYLVVYPRKVAKITSWHKVTKHQWARDDPGFVVIQVALLLVSSLAWGVAISKPGFAPFARLICWSLFVDYLLAGAIFASISWFLCNKFLVTDGIHRTEQKVEWLYAFDVHCNAFFLEFLVVHVLQFFLLPLLVSRSFLSTILANSIYAFGYLYYLYITFLGYQVLPFLHNVEYFLLPGSIILLTWVILLVCNVNFSVLLLNVYFYNV